uniref:HNH endonuclease n=2 Tax=unclassified bacterial viruses TaxID=12333 RepID=A0AAU7J7L6_9VIRU
MRMYNRMMSRCVPGPGGCIMWTGAVGKNGYGNIGLWNPRRIEYVHRLAYRVEVGPIPEGYQIDHVRKSGCTSILCVNRHHLEAVTQAENLRRQHERQLA